MIDYKAIARSSGASQDKFELWQLLELVGRIEPSVIVEIGIDKGHSMATWIEAFHPDIIAGINDQMDAFDYQINEAFSDTVIVGDSHDTKILTRLQNKLGKEPIDFLFIDGDHNYQGVRSDYEMYAPLVRRGGIIAMHDTMRTPGQIMGVEVHKLFNELRATNNTIEFWGGGTSPGTGIIFK